MKVCNLENLISNTFTLNVNKNALSSNSLKVGDVLKGKVKSIDKNKNLVNIDVESLGNIKLNLNSLNKKVKENDQINFEVNSLENGKVNIKEILNEVTDELNIDKVSQNLSSKDVYNNIDVTKKIAERNDTQKSNSNEDEEDNDNILGRLNNNAVEEKIEDILNHDDLYVKDLSVEKFTNMISCSARTGNDVNYDTSMTTEDILKTLNINVTQENVSYVEDMLNKVDIIDSALVDDTVILDMVESTEPVTLNNLYKSIYNNKNSKGFNDKNKKQTTEELADIKEIDKQIENILRNQDIEVTSENKEISKKLIENGKEISKRNILRYKSVKETLNNLSKDKIINQMAENISSGNNVDVTLANLEELNYEVNEIKNVINKVIDNNNSLQDLSLKYNVNRLNLEQIRNYIENNSLNKKTMLINENTIEEIDNLNVTQLKENLNEMRLMLTVNSMSKMYAKGIDVNIKPIKDLANVLKNISNLEEDTLSINLFNKTYEDINVLKNRDFRIYTDYADISSKSNATLDVLASKNKQIINSYESLENTVRYTLDSEINITQRNIESVMDMNNIEINETNKSAAIALSLNNIDVTIENVNNISKLENDLSYVIDNLMPKITLDMIEKALDPTNMPLSEIIDYIDKFNNENNSRRQNKDMITELTNLLNSSSTNDKQKEALIGIYRILNKVTATNKAGIGSYNNESIVSLEDIYNATKRLNKNENIDVIIDSKFGMLKDINNIENNAINIVRESLEELRNEENMKEGKILRKEKLLQTIKNVDLEKELLNNIYDDIKVKTTSEIESILDFENSKTTISHILNDVIKYSDNETLKEEIDKTIKDITMQVENEEVDKVYESISRHNDNIKELTKEILDKDILSKISNNSFSNDTTNITNVNKTISDVIKDITNVSKVLESNNAISMPMYINEEITNVNIYFNEFNEESNNLKMTLSIDLRNIGEVISNINIDDLNEHVEVNIMPKNKDAVSVLKDNVSLIKGVFEDLGYKNTNIKINGYNVNSLTKESMSGQINSFNNTSFEKII